jgi:hypothetical protein
MRLVAALLIIQQSLVFIPIQPKAELFVANDEEFDVRMRTGREGGVSSASG